MTRKELAKKYDTIGMSIHLLLGFIESWIKFPRDASRRKLHQDCSTGLSIRDRS
jgi:hypothetical protein